MPSTLASSLDPSRTPDPAAGFGEGASTLHAAFEAQVAQTPELPAVVAGADVLSYAVLDARSRALAHALKARGVGRGDLVALYTERSAAMVVGMLGILRVGAAYVPVDPAYPAERLRLVLDDTRAPVVVVEDGLAPRLPGAASGLVLAADGRLAGEAPPPVAAPEVDGDDLAYVIYTSGSTGTPKGVLVAHRSVLDYVRGVADALGLTPGARYAMVQPPTVDSCVTMLYPALLSGGTLHVVSETLAADPAGLGTYLRQHAIDALKIAPSHLAALVQAAPQPATLMPRRWLIVGGEVSQRSWVETLQALAPDCAIFNHYGPTEATVGVTTYRVPFEGSGEGTLPIGWPLPGTRAYVLDADGRRVAPGVTGELYVGGACLALGYLNHPDLTAARFVRDPFSDDPDARLYRTGDLVHARSDGALVFHGRADDQVKINGYRIEPGEVEAALNRHPAVQQSLVHAIDGPGGKRLVGYVVSRDGPLEAATLRAFLQRTLPPPLVPSAFVTLDALPRSAHGKVDRKALPVPAHRASEETPQTELERQVAAIWADVLDVETVGRHDNFFDLGGHSLLAIRILGRVREQTGTPLALPDLFETPTVAGLAATLAAQPATASAARTLRPLEGQNRASGPLPLSLAQRRLWFLTRLQPESPLYNMVKGFRLRGALDLAALQAALDGLVARHEVLRTRYVAEQGEPMQVVDPPASVPVRHARVAVGDEAALAHLLRDEARTPFDLERDRVVRALVVTLAPDDHAFLLVIHHIAFDGLSQLILMRELAERYAAAHAGGAPEVPPLTVQYADYAAWHRDAVSGPRVDAHLRYWKQHLRDLPVLTLPPDGARPAQLTYRGAERGLEIDPGVVAPVQALRRAEQVSPFMLLLAVFDVLLAFYTGEDDLPVGATVAGREQRAAEHLIGFFANMVVMRLDVSGDPTFREVLRRVRRVALDAYAHQDAPFERVVEAVQQPRDPRYAPLVQVVFALQDAAAMRLDLPGVQATPLEIDNGTAKYDLVFDVIMDGDVPVSSLLEYNTDLYADETARRFLWRYNTLLHLAATRPDAPLSALRQALDTAEAEAQQAAASRVGAANQRKLQALRPRAGR